MSFDHQKDDTGGILKTILCCVLFWLAFAALIAFSWSCAPAPKAIPLDEMAFWESLETMDEIP